MIKEENAQPLINDPANYGSLSNYDISGCDLTKPFYDIDDVFGYRAFAVLSYIFHNASKSKENSFTISGVSKNIQLPPASLRLIIIKMEMKGLLKIKYKLGKSNVYGATDKGINIYLKSISTFFHLANEQALFQQLGLEV